MADVVIVGGGVIGCATAYFLARDGASVTLLERGELAGEASGAAAGMLAALSDEGGDRGPAFQQLCLDSFALFAELQSELASTGIDLRYNSTGGLHLALEEYEVEKLRHRYDQQRVAAPENIWLEADELRKHEPHANPKALTGLGQHYLDPQRLTLALAEAARQAGAKIETGINVEGVTSSGGKLAISTAAGAYEGDAVLLAAGPWTAQLAESLGAAIPVRPVRGQMISLRGPNPSLKQIVWGEGGYLVPREDGQTYVGATVEEAGFERVNTAEGIARLRSAAAALVPPLADAELVRAWSGLRPGTPDALPIMGTLPGFENLWVATGHYRNGILLAPITGKLIAEGIIAGEPPGRLQPFSPARFVS